MLTFAALRGVCPRLASNGSDLHNTNKCCGSNKGHGLVLVEERLDVDLEGDRAGKGNGDGEVTFQYLVHSGCNCTVGNATCSWSNTIFTQSRSLYERPYLWMYLPQRGTKEEAMKERLEGPCLLHRHREIIKDVLGQPRMNK